MNDCIFIEQLHIDTLIGVLPHERVRKQRLIIDIELATDFSAAAASDKVSDAINYAAVADHIAAFADQAEFGLLEAFASALINSVFAAYPATTITLTIKKPGAIAATRELGIRLQRQRP
ncbi:dihydroneopterin aldolase [Suttonella sp. R2A3]|uniref:dihydroneopterin aldolase n=1 Tax=Suttonella sp. R2A3 TaxID=2908648 RepID=UPI001F212099|nr:dihydroneopterin aldolase [Suttonella sp. R2A3]UJF24650.1 dihydroneopterin aldolase [Suttonella sp. R2A3]